MIYWIISACILWLLSLVVTYLMGVLNGYDICSREKRTKPMLHKAIEEAYKLKKERGWDTLYFAIDLHGTIIEPGRLIALSPYPDAAEALGYLSEQKDIVLILFTSTKAELLGEFYEWCGEHLIRFKYFNENPECVDSHEGDYTKKFYYNVILDDRAGFDPTVDWRLVMNTVKGCIQRGASR